METIRCTMKAMLERLETMDVLIHKVKRGSQFEVRVMDDFGRMYDITISFKAVKKF